jgi:sugar phosphate permease
MLGAATASQMGCSLVHQGMPALAPLIQAEWALSRGELGVVVAAVNVGVLLTSIVSGDLVDRIGERPLLVVGPLGVMAAALLASVAGSPPLLTLSLVAVGMFVATNGPAGGKAMLVWFSPRIRGLAMGLRQTSVPLAGAVAAATLPLLAAGLGWRGALGVAALASGFAALLPWLIYRDPPDPPATTARHRTGVRAIPALLRDRSQVATILLGPVLVAGHWTIVPYLGLYLYERFQLPVAVAAGYLALAQVGGVCGRIGWGLASDAVWHGRRKPALACIPPLGALLVVVLAALPTTTPAPLLALLALALGATLIGWNALALTYQAEQAGPHRAGTALGLGITVIFVGAVLIPPAFGALVDRLGSYQPAWLVLAAVLLSGLGLFPLMREVGPAPARAES